MPIPMMLFPFFSVATIFSFSVYSYLSATMGLRFAARRAG